MVNAISQTEWHNPWIRQSLVASGLYRQIVRIALGRVFPRELGFVLALLVKAVFRGSGKALEVHRQADRLRRVERVGPEHDLSCRRVTRWLCAVHRARTREGEGAHKCAECPTDVQGFSDVL